MTVRKARNIEEAASVPAARRLDGNNLRSAIELSELCLRLRPITSPHGVRRFASVEEAAEHRRSWERAALTDFQ